MRAIHEYLVAQANLMALLPGGVHDTTARFFPPAGRQNVRYPYLALTIVDVVDNSSFTGTASGMLRLQTDIWDQDASGIDTGEASKVLNEVLDALPIADGHGEYHPITLKADIAHYIQEEGKVYRISQDFTGLVHRTSA